jgi:alpha-tubulin suppressor-like RCC1 family protein
VNTGLLGYGREHTVVGNDETPADVGDVAVGGTVVQLATGGSTSHMCAITDDGALRCWGQNPQGELGLGHTETVGDDETPANYDPVRVLD